MKVQYRALEPVADGGWILLHIPGLNHCTDTKGMVAVDLERNKTVGAVIFDNWTPNAVHAHIILEEPMVLRYGFLEEAFHYAFITAGRQFMLATIQSNNKKSLKFVKHIGFNEICRIENGYEDGVDIVMLSADREHCRFIEKSKEAVNV